MGRDSHTAPQAMQMMTLNYVRVAKHKLEYAKKFPSVLKPYPKHVCRNESFICKMQVNNNSRKIVGCRC
jgi:hypothetical protein